MKNIIRNFGFMILATAVMAVSCDTKEVDSVSFGPDKSDLTVGPEGGTEALKVQAGENWLASTEQPWILISPANGNSTQECKIRIDSTYQDAVRTGEVRFTSAGETRTVKINQMGFAKQIIVDGASNGVYNVDIPDYAPFGTTHFDVTVTTNVDFTVQIDDESISEEDTRVGSIANWIRAEEFKLNLIQSKPRTVKLRFKWDYNTKWWEQLAKIKFVPKSGDVLTNQDVVAVRQSKAPRITNDRAGDSIAVLAVGRQLGLWGQFDSSKPMTSWGENIKLYDKSAPKELQGRVKYVKFYIFSTKQGIPFEIRYLNKTEEIIFYGNTNHTSLGDLDLGTSICELAQYGNLKRLTIDAYGFSKLPSGFEALGSSLEELSLGANTFKKIPAIITKENFPKLKKLDMGGNRSFDVYDLSNSPFDEPGLSGGFPRHLLEWEGLEHLGFSYNYFDGSIPSMEDYPIKWTAEDGYSTLIGKPKILPNCKMLRLNLNRFTGIIPDWILTHPKLREWDPYTLLFSQEGKDKQGRRAGFDNEPETLTPAEKDK